MSRCLAQLTQHNTVMLDRAQINQSRVRHTNHLHLVPPTKKLIKSFSVSKCLAQQTQHSDAGQSPDHPTKKIDLKLFFTKKVILDSSPDSPKENSKTKRSLQFMVIVIDKRVITLLLHNGISNNCYQKALGC